jgi:hypothetical protein
MTSITVYLTTNARSSAGSRPNGKTQEGSGTTAVIVPPTGSPPLSRYSLSVYRTCQLTVRTRTPQKPARRVHLCYPPDASSSVTLALASVCYPLMYVIAQLMRMHTRRLHPTLELPPHRTRPKQDDERRVGSPVGPRGAGTRCHTVWMTCCSTSKLSMGSHEAAR